MTEDRNIIIEKVHEKFLEYDLTPQNSICSLNLS